MTSPRSRLILLAVIGLCTVAGDVGSALAQGAAPGDKDASARLPDWTFGVSLYPEYSEGKYGTRHTTRILYAPVIGEWSPTDRLDLRLTIPYLWERGHDIFAVVGGGTIRSAPRVQARRRAPTAGVRTEEGLGDVLLEAEFVILEDRGVLPEIAPFVQIKFPTADSSTGLGTGAFDETLGVGFTKALGMGWSAHLDVWYTFVGSPPRTRLDDSFGWLVGVGYGVTRSLNLTAYLEGATAVSTRGDDPLDVRLEAIYKITSVLEVLVGGSAGLSDASPAFSVSTGLRLRF